MHPCSSQNPGAVSDGVRVVKAQGPPRTCNESKAEEEEEVCALFSSWHAACVVHPLSSEHGTYETVKARFSTWLSGKLNEHVYVFPSSLGRGP